MRFLFDDLFDDGVHAVGVCRAVFSHGAVHKAQMPQKDQHALLVQTVQGLVPTIPNKVAAINKQNK